MTKAKKRRNRPNDSEVEQETDIVIESERTKTDHQCERPLDGSKEKMTFDGRKLHEIEENNEEDE